MKVAWLDTFSGISGDMTLGAFISAGVDVATLEQALRGLHLDGWTLVTHTIQRSMISAVKLDVVVDGMIEEPAPSIDHPHDPERTHDPGSAFQDEHAHEHGHAHAHAQGRAHAHAHAHEHVREGEHVHEHEHAHPAHNRSYREILALIDEAQLSDSVKQHAKTMFACIADAEARVHGTTPDEVHFHEVGAVDSIIDIVGVAVCMELLGIERVYSTPVRTGSRGFIRTQHGVMPVPAPATLEILKGYPIELTDIPFELTTPTGAAIVRTLSTGILHHEAELCIEQIGYGAGSRELPGLPNMLRLVIGTMEGDVEEEALTVLETNIDDMNPEIYPWLIERLFAHGAHDAYLTPVLMKKGRPGQLLTVICDAGHRDALITVICTESTTTGVRIREVHRKKVPRDIVRVDTRFGAVMAKEIHAPNGLRRVPEYEECRRIAIDRGLPLQSVYHALEQDLNKMDEQG